MMIIAIMAVLSGGFYNHLWPLSQTNGAWSRKQKLRHTKWDGEFEILFNWYKCNIWTSVCIHSSAGPIKTDRSRPPIFSWLPVLLWILIDGVFFQTVQFASMYASVKNKTYRIYHPGVCRKAWKNYFFILVAVLYSGRCAAFCRCCSRNL